MESNEARSVRCEVGSEEATVVVIEAVADVESVHPLELPPLYESIDPDVLDAIARSEVGDECQVAFSYFGYRVEVDATGAVTVTPELN